jgi:RHS repeat-associated protein
VLPKYSFNAKELDEETGMYYYEARYYKPPVFTSRDAMMEKKPWLSPYHYCSNNPVGRIDPSGMFDKEKQAEKSREKALKQYGRENVSNILKNEDGQYYYNIYGNTSVSYRNDGCKTGGYTRLNTAIVKLETRQVLRRSDYRKCIRQDQLGLFSRTNEISFGFAFGTTGAVFCLDAYPDYIPLKEAKIAKGFYKAGKFASGVGVVAGIANVVNSSIRAADDGRISFGEGLRICIQLGATISSGFPGIGTAISLGISTIDLFWGDSIEKIGSK